MSQSTLTDRPPTTFICVICIDELAPVEEGDYIILTPCFHAFHANCLLKWLNANPTAGTSATLLAENAIRGTCPNCQSNITMDACNKIYLNSASGGAHYQDDLRVREELANARADQEKTKADYHTLKLRFNSLRTKLGPNTAIVVNGTNVDIIRAAPLPPDFETATMANRSPVGTTRTMPRRSPAPTTATMLPRETSSAPPQSLRAVVLTVPNRDDPFTSTSVKVTIIHADQNPQAPGPGV